MIEKQSIHRLLLLTSLLTITQMSTSKTKDGNTYNQCKDCLKTAKERLGRKADDEQRVNNCKVPVQLRGSKLRSTICSHKKRKTLKIQ